MIIVLLLHDLSEDTYLLSPFRIGLNFGRDIAFDVRSLTKLPNSKGKPKELTEEYLRRIIKQGPWAITAKLCDRLHNLRTLEACTPEKRRGQINETRQCHLPLLVSALRKYGGQWEGYANFLEAKIKEALDHVELLE